MNARENEKTYVAKSEIEDFTALKRVPSSDRVLTHMTWDRLLALLPKWQKIANRYSETVTDEQRAARASIHTCEEMSRAWGACAVGQELNLRSHDKMRVEDMLYDERSERAGEYPEHPPYNDAAAAVVNTMSVPDRLREPMMNMHRLGVNFSGYISACDWEKAGDCLVKIKQIVAEHPKLIEYADKKFVQKLDEFDTDDRYEAVYDE